MRLRKDYRGETRLTDISGLCAYLCMGRNSAIKFAKEHDLVVRISGMVRYDLRKADKVLEELYSGD